ncbi:MAG: helix-turn-helix domain-containing protein [Propionibacteriaceae bacterium]|nr:helix-turn-helix domain-containing protein [Propionibacteriaceae bacterium]
MSTARNTELMAERLWSIDDLAGYLGVSKSTVYDWRNRGQGPVAHRLGKHLKYARADVDAWLASRRDDAPVGGAR